MLINSAQNQTGTESADSRYSCFLSTQSGRHWKQIGLKRRAGVLTPLFSIYSENSIGIGEFPDIKLLADWCAETGLSLIQLLPLNDVGFGFRPYDSESTFALDPMYLSLDRLVAADLRPHRIRSAVLRARYPRNHSRVDYGIKQAKLEFLWEVFSQSENKRNSRFIDYVNQNNYWLRDYTLFKVLKEIHRGQSWEVWPAAYRDRNKAALQKIESEHRDKIEFHKWLQWQIFEQFRATRDYLTQRRILLMGDLPFLVSRDSADVWAHSNLFKLDLIAGAPPDLYFALGQRWGMPPYHWENIKSENYSYLIERLRYAENFYDCFRIDHFVGLFRIWTIAASEPIENGGLNGVFDPADESLWEDHGRRILSVMLDNTKMLPCAEDLGVVPPCSFKVLEEFGLPGMDIQRWMRDWGNTYDFLDAKRYRKNSVSTISTHDMSIFTAWWQFEAGTIDEALYKRALAKADLQFEQLKEKLFDLKGSRHLKLRWRRDIRDIDHYLEILNIPKSAADELVYLFLSSFDEQDKALRFLLPNQEPHATNNLELLKAAVQENLETESIFNIQSLQDWLCLSGDYFSDAWNARINFPGVVGEQNWSIVMPVSLEDMRGLKISPLIKSMSQAAGRAQ